MKLKLYPHQEAMLKQMKALLGKTAILEYPIGGFNYYAIAPFQAREISKSAQRLIVMRNTRKGKK